MGGVGFASRPCSSVSANRRWLYSSSTLGTGICKTGRTSSRSVTAQIDTRSTASTFRLAILLKQLSIRWKKRVPELGRVTLTRSADSASTVSSNISMANDKLPQVSNWYHGCFVSMEELFLSRICLFQKRLGPWQSPFCLPRAPASVIISHSQRADNRAFRRVAICAGQ
jgi:hypothetical protein